MLNLFYADVSEGLIFKPIELASTISQKSRKSATVTGSSSMVVSVDDNSVSNSRDNSPSVSYQHKQLTMLFCRFHSVDFKIIFI